MIIIKLLLDFTQPTHCEEDRIEGAFKYGQYWLIPKDAQKLPEKERRM